MNSSFVMVLGLYEIFLQLKKNHPIEFSLVACARSGLIRCSIVPNPRGGRSPGPGWASRGQLGHLPLSPLPTITALSVEMIDT